MGVVFIRTRIEGAVGLEKGEMSDGLYSRARRSGMEQAALGGLGPVFHRAEDLARNLGLTVRPLALAISQAGAAEAAQ